MRLPPSKYQPVPFPSLKLDQQSDHQVLPAQYLLNKKEPNLHQSVDLISCVIQLYALKELQLVDLLVGANVPQKVAQLPGPLTSAKSGRRRQHQLQIFWKVQCKYQPKFYDL